MSSTGYGIHTQGQRCVCVPWDFISAVNIPSTGNVVGGLGWCGWVWLVGKVQITQRKFHNNVRGARYTRVLVIHAEFPDTSQSIDICYDKSIISTNI